VTNLILARKISLTDAPKIFPVASQWSRLRPPVHPRSEPAHQAAPAAQPPNDREFPNEPKPPEDAAAGIRNPSNPEDQVEACWLCTTRPVSVGSGFQPAAGLCPASGFGCGSAALPGQALPCAGVQSRSCADSARNPQTRQEPPWRESQFV